MTVRTKLLSGRIINTDSDFSKYIETVSEAGVIEGLEVSENSVGIGKCWIPCERTNGETIFPLVINDSAKTIDTSGTGYVIIEISQNYIDDGSLINEDGINVAEIKVVDSLPTKNYLKLSDLSSGTITDKRNIIKKVGEIYEDLSNLSDFVDDINERVEELEEAGAINHLEEQAVVGELYDSISQSMFRQLTPNNTDSIVEDCHVGDVAANTEIHIQRIANGVESNELKLKVKMNGSPTTSLKVEVRKGVQVNVSNTQAYWYGDENEILATGSVAYTSFSTNWSEVTFTLDNSIDVDKGTLLDIVVFQESGGSKVVNSTNYYILACDSTQWSEAFSYVSVNGSTRTRSNLMPYCISNSFEESLLCKLSNNTINKSKTVTPSKNATAPGTQYELYTITEYANKISGNVSYQANTYYEYGYVYIYKSDGTKSWSKEPINGNEKSGAVEFSNIDIDRGSVVKVAYGRYQYNDTVRFSSSLSYTYYLYKNIGEKNRAIRNSGLQAIGSIVDCTTFGRHIDGSWITGN